MAKSHFRMTPAVRKRLIALVREGLCNPHIAAILQCERHTVGDWRKRLGLPASRGQKCERCRRETSERTKAQCDSAGLPSLAQLRVRRYRQFARESGWPEDLRPRAVHILNALYERGPMTRREIAEAVGMPWKGSRKSLVSNDPEGSYLAHLLNRGFVVVQKRACKGRGRGRSTSVYMIPLTIHRGRPATWPGKSQAQTA